MYKIELKTNEKMLLVTMSGLIRKIIELFVKK